MFETLRDETRSPYAPAIFSADLKAGITLTASCVPTAMALGALDRIPKDRIVESEEEAGTLAWSLVQRP
ncbi:MAG: hypothetical protein OXH59_12070 [Rhodospirillaceae bacterium]|nr:hypothetical protein [Rhodospirillaceae bacterium]